MRTALVCIAKNEDNYIREWAEHHLKLGFTDVFIYQNDWRCKEDLGPHVKLIEFDGKVKQLESYNNFIIHQSRDYDWAMFMDCDEFIWLDRFRDVSDMFSNYSDYMGLALNWKFFGDSDLKFSGDYSVLSRFTKCQKGFDRHVKTAVNLKRMRDEGVNDLRFTNPHFVNISMGNAIVNSTRTACVHGAWNDVKGEPKMPFIGHFFCKTQDEYIFRRSYGRADTNSKRGLGDFTSMNHNEDEFLGFRDTVSLV